MELSAPFRTRFQICYLCLSNWNLPGLLHSSDGRDSWIRISKAMFSLSCVRSKAHTYLFIYLTIFFVPAMTTSSLRTGSPLPQITPCPLLDRFLLQYHGFNVIHKESEEDYGLPRSMTFDTLKNEQYLSVILYLFLLETKVFNLIKFIFVNSMFSVGIITAFNIINRLDQLMLAVKEVVGEHYHIHGVGSGTSANPILKEGVRGFTTQFRPPGDDVV